MDADVQAAVNRLQAQLLQLQQRVTATELAIEQAVERAVDARIRVLEQKLNVDDGKA